MQKARREWAAPEDKGQQARGLGGVRRAARQLWELQETGHFPEPQFPVLWNGVAALGWGAAGRSLALVPSQLSGGGAGFRVVGWRQIALR